MKFTKTLSDWLSSRYQLIIRNEENFEDKRKIAYTPAKILFFSFIAFTLIFTFGFFIASRIYNRTVFSGQDLAMSRKLIRLSNTVDSLNTKIQARDNYMTSLKKLLGGDVKYLKDEQALKTKAKKVAAISESVNIDFLDKADVKLRQEFESGRAGGVANYKEDKLDNLYLFTPLKGIISDKYNAKDAHFGVDIVSEKDEPIKTVAEGTVILSSWTDDTGYVIAVQHKSDLISVYKHCSVLLKKVGNFVKAGEIVAIIGNTGKYTSGPHLHFELWYKGNPMNPEELISF